MKPDFTEHCERVYISVIKRLFASDKHLKCIPLLRTNSASWLSWE